MTPEQIVGLTADQRADVEARAKAGDAGAIRDFVFVSAWRAIVRDQYIPADKRVESFKALCSEVSLSVDQGETIAKEVMANG